MTEQGVCCKLAGSCNTESIELLLETQLLQWNHNRKWKIIGYDLVLLYDNMPLTAAIAGLLAFDRLL